MQRLHLEQHDEGRASSAGMRTNCGMKKPGIAVEREVAESVVKQGWIEYIDKGSMLAWNCMVAIVALQRCAIDLWHGFHIGLSVQRWICRSAVHSCPLSALAYKQQHTLCGQSGKRLAACFHTADLQ